MNLVALFLIGLSSTGTHKSVEEIPYSLTELAERYCIAPDGDHRVTWASIQRDGFVQIPSEEYEGLRLPGSVASAIRAFRRNADGREFRVLTSSSWLQAPDQGKTYYRWCWVSSSDERLDRVVSAFQRKLGDRGFRSQRVRLFAWIPRPDNADEPVSRRRYMREHNVLARELGMRQVLISPIGDGVSIGYASPRDEATYRQFDWGGPEPVPVPVPE